MFKFGWDYPCQSVLYFITFVTFYLSSLIKLFKDFSPIKENFYLGLLKNSTYLGVSVFD